MKYYRLFTADYTFLPLEVIPAPHEKTAWAMAEQFRLEFPGLYDEYDLMEFDSKRAAYEYCRERSRQLMHRCHCRRNSPPTRSS